MYVWLVVDNSNADWWNLFLLSLQTEFQTVGIFAMDLICQSAGMMWPYLFCHFANLTTDRVLANRNVVYDLNWIDYPVRMRKYIILLIARSQQPIIFSGLFLFPCSLEVFGLVSVIALYIIFWSIFIISVLVFFGLAALQEIMLVLYDFPKFALKMTMQILMDFLSSFSAPAPIVFVK